MRKLTTKEERSKLYEPAVVVVVAGVVVVARVVFVVLGAETTNR